MPSIAPAWRFGDRDLWVGDNFEDELVDPREIWLEVPWETLQGNVVVGHPFDELERTAADRLLVERAVGVRAHDARDRRGRR